MTRTLPGTTLLLAGAAAFRGRSLPARLRGGARHVMSETGGTLNEFLADAHKRLQDKRLQEVGTVRLVVGNEASDPDSCVSAIAVAHELAHAWPAAAWPDTVAAPVLAIPRAAAGARGRAAA